MIKKLVKHGNSLALILDKPVLELLKITEDTALEIQTIDGKSLHIAPASAHQAEAIKTVKAALKRTNKKFGKTLRNLAK